MFNWYLHFINIRILKPCPLALTNQAIRRGQAFFIFVVLKVVVIYVISL